MAFTYIHRLVSCHHQRDFLKQQMGTGAEVHRHTLCRERGSIGGLHRSPHSELREFVEEGLKRLYKSEKIEDIRRQWPTESTKQDSHGLTENEAEESTGHHGSTPGPLHSFYGC